jgi:predicted protein tyrosine phosphatase
MIVVSSFWALEDALKLYRPAYLISLMDNVDAVHTPENIDASNHLRLGFHDVEGKTPWNTPPSTEDIDKIIEVAFRWKNSGEPILVHCTAGVSRSPAAGLILSSIRQPNTEAEQAMHLREKAPYCRPNKLMIKLADQALSLKGKLIDATANMGKPDYETRPQPFVLNLY